MLSHKQIHELVREHIELKERTSLSRLLPKKATVVDATVYGNQNNYYTGCKKTEKGRAYSHHRLMCERTVFRPDPIEIEGEMFYLEIKGYGADGRSLYPFHHTEGDLHYGMYLHHAEREFSLLKEADDLQTQKALALLVFPKEEFIKQSFRGLAGLLWMKISPRYSRRHDLGSSEASVGRELFSMYQQKGLGYCIKFLKPYFAEMSHPLSKFEKINKPAGYLVRATRAPLRIAVGDELRIPKSDLNDAAYKAGETYRRLLERKIIHLVPSQGNITIAGELMDFEDATKVEDRNEIRKSWKFMVKQFKSARIKTFEDYLALTLSESFLGKFIHPFLSGAKLGETPRKVAKRIVEMHCESFSELIS